MGHDRRRDTRTREVLRNIEGDWQHAIVEVKEKYERERRLLRWAVRWMLVITVGLCAFVTVAIVSFNAEQAERRDQSCAITEGQQRDEVVQLRRTYDYLLSLSPAERRDPLNRAILAQLTQTEARAKQDNAPEFCDDDGVGLPEPDMPVPDRPLALR